MAANILSLAAIVLCSMALQRSLEREQWMTALGFVILVLVNAALLFGGMG